MELFVPRKLYLWSRDLQRSMLHQQSKPSHVHELDFQSRQASFWTLRRPTQLLIMAYNRENTSKRRPTLASTPSSNKLKLNNLHYKALYWFIRTSPLQSAVILLPWKRFLKELMTHQYGTMVLLTATLLNHRRKLNPWPVFLSRPNYEHPWLS